MIVLGNKDIEKLRKICKSRIKDVYINKFTKLTIFTDNGIYYAKNMDTYNLKNILNCHYIILNLLNSENENEIILGLILL